MRYLSANLSASLAFSRASCSIFCAFVLAFGLAKRRSLVQRRRSGDVSSLHAACRALALSSRESAASRSLSARVRSSEHLARSVRLLTFPNGLGDILLTQFQTLLRIDLTNCANCVKSLALQYLLHYPHSPKYKPLTIIDLLWIGALQFSQYIPLFVKEFNWTLQHAGGRNIRLP